MKLILLFSVLASCSSSQEYVKGYSGRALEGKLSLIEGKTPTETLKIWGNPAIRGACSSCGPKVLYRMIYMTETVTRFHLNVTANTDVKQNCVVLDFFPDAKTNKYTFVRATGLSEGKNCNNPAGAIFVLKQKLEEQIDKEIAEKKLQKANLPTTLPTKTTILKQQRP